MSRPFLMATSQDKDKWSKCKKCGERVKILYADTKLCFKCEEERPDRI